MRGLAIFLTLSLGVLAAHAASGDVTSLQIGVKVRSCRAWNILMVCHARGNDSPSPDQP